MKNPLKTSLKNPSLFQEAYLLDLLQLSAPVALIVPAVVLAVQVVASMVLVEGLPEERVQVAIGNNNPANKNWLIIYSYKDF